MRPYVKKEYENDQYISVNKTIKQISTKNRETLVYSIERNLNAPVCKKEYDRFPEPSEERGWILNTGWCGVISVLTGAEIRFSSGHLALALVLLALVCFGFALLWVVSKAFLSAAAAVKRKSHLRCRMRSSARAALKTDRVGRHSWFHYIPAVHAAASPPNSGLARLRRRLCIAPSTAPGPTGRARSLHAHGAHGAAPPRYVAR